MTGWLIGHPEYNHLIKAAVLWNPVINMSYMISSTDIPDWIYACCLNRELSYPPTVLPLLKKTKFSIISLPSVL